MDKFLPMKVLYKHDNVYANFALRVKTSPV